MRTFSGQVVTAAGMTPATITEADGIITGISHCDKADLPVLFPGFVDIHNHGGAGESFPTSTLSGCRTAARYHARNGTTDLLASLVSAPASILLNQTHILAELAAEQEITGIHLEGPFINRHRCGAQNPTAIIPGNPSLLAKLAEAAAGFLRSVTFAPETANATNLIDVCADYGIIASLGHTNADADQTWEIIWYALNKGVKVTATHLFNAMPHIHHRLPGAAVALFDAASRGLVTAELVADGVHLNDHMVDLVRNAAAGNSVFITDAMAAAGMPDGQYQLGGVAVRVEKQTARVTTSGALAGGTSTMYMQLLRHCRAGWQLSEMTDLVAGNAARLLGLKAGELAVGNYANFLVLGENLDLQAVYRRGQLIG